MKLLAGHMVNSRSRFCPTPIHHKPHRQHMFFFQSLAVNKFGKNIRDVFGSVDFGEGEIMGTEFILYPEVGCREVPGFPQATAFAHADSSSGVIGIAIWSSMFKSLATLRRPMDWEAPRQMPVNSASALLKATVVCVDDQWRMRWEPLMAAPPEVERRVTKHPPKSVSTYVVSCDVYGWKSNRHTNLFFPIR